MAWDVLSRDVLSYIRKMGLIFYSLFWFKRFNGIYALDVICKLLLI